MKNLEIGATYRHYKGGKYKVLHEAQDSENGEHMVVYQRIEDESIWIRPKHMFLENIIFEGKEIERFKKIEE